MEAGRTARGRSASEATVVIVDQHALARAGLASLLRGEDDLRLVGEAQSGTEALAVCRRHQPDLVVMEARLGDIDAVALTRRLVAELPHTRVVVFTFHESPEYADAVLRAGARAYLLKGAPRDEILSTIRGALGA